jgi:hypothetical protein
VPIIEDPHPFALSPGLYIGPIVDPGSKGPPNPFDEPLFPPIVDNGDVQFEFPVPRNAFAKAATGHASSFTAAVKGAYDVAVTMHDAAGHETTKVLRFTVGQRNAAIGVAAATATAVTAVERDPGASGPGTLRLAADRDHPGEAPLPAAPAGKPGLSTQLRAAGRQGHLADRQALLASLHNGPGD